MEETAGAAPPQDSGSRGLEHSAGADEFRIPAVEADAAQELREQKKFLTQQKKS